MYYLWDRVKIKYKYKYKGDFLLISASRETQKATKSVYHKAKRSCMRNIILFKLHVPSGMNKRF